MERWAFTTEENWYMVSPDPRGIRLEGHRAAMPKIDESGRWFFPSDFTSDGRRLLGTVREIRAGRHPLALREIGIYDLEDESLPGDRGTTDRRSLRSRLGPGRSADPAWRNRRDPPGTIRIRGDVAMILVNEGPMAQNFQVTDNGLHLLLHAGRRAGYLDRPSRTRHAGTDAVWK